MSKIIFMPEEQKLFDYLLKPVPAIEYLPDWYKNSNSYVDEKVKYEDGLMNQTYKRCLPFFDALTSGYYILLNSDIYVDPDNDAKYKFKWKPSFDFITSHNLRQKDLMQIDSSYFQVPFKWKSFWCIKTKPGYSCLIMHPINRLDLPFYTLSGVVDTDKYCKLSTNFPFFIKNDFGGIIKRGTPIAQIIPFKRSNWKMDIAQNKSDIGVESQIINSYIQDFYRKFHWSKKSYR